MSGREMEMTNEGETRSVDYISCVLLGLKKEKRKRNIVKGDKRAGNTDDEK